MQTERRVTANPQTKPVDLGCESTENWQLLSTSTIAIVIITQPTSRYSFYRTTKGGRLSRPRHCRKVHSPCPRLYIIAAVAINTTVRGVIRTLVSHTAVGRASQLDVSVLCEYAIVAYFAYCRTFHIFQQIAHIAHFSE